MMLPFNGHTIKHARSDDFVRIDIDTAHTVCRRYYVQAKAVHSVYMDK